MAIVLPKILTDNVGEITPDSGVTIDNVVLKDGVVQYLNNVQNTKNWFNASSAPTSSNDTTQGYTPGCTWVDTTNDKAYICVDNTASAATWTEITAAPGGGEANTASNIGTAGVGIFKDKIGSDLRFKKINAGSNKVTITDDTGNNEVDLDVAEANIVHANLSGAGTNTHAQIDSHIANTSNPHSVTKTQIGLGDVQNLKANLNASVAPTGNEDSGDGYAVGSTWIDTTNDKSYICIDNTLGSAIWKQFNNIKNNNILTVGSAGSGTDYTSISSALTAASTLSPSATNPIGILVYPGVYTETNPLTTLQYVDISSAVGQHVTIIQPSTATAEVFNVVQNSGITGFTITGATGTGGIGIKISSTGGDYAKVFNCDIKNCKTGLQATGATTRLKMNKINIYQTVTDNIVNAIEVLSGAFVESFITNIYLAGGTQFIKGIYVDGANSNMDAFTTHINNSVDGIYVSNSASIHLATLDIHDCTNGIHIASTNGTVEMSGTSITNNTTYDIFAEGSSSLVTGSGNHIDTPKFNIHANATFNISFADMTTYNQSFKTVGKSTIGRYDRSSQLSVGGGGSYTDTMKVFWNTNQEAGTWTDKTEDAINPTASSFNVFPGITANNTIYIGGDYIFYALVLVLTQVITLGSGVITWEYWNGAAWTTFKILVTLEVSPYTQNAQNAFQTTTDTHIRFGTMTGWATKSLNGSTKYWIRCLITTAITTSPIVERIKLHSSGTKIGNDGIIEYFGNAKPLVEFPTLIVGTGPASQSIQISSSITLPYIDNRFSDSSDSSLYLVVPIEDGIDTSIDIEFEAYWISDTTTGNVNFTMVYAGIPHIGQQLGSLSETTLQSIVTVPATTNTLTESEFDIDISALKYEDWVTIRLRRNANPSNTNDTAAGYAAVLKIKARGFRWKSR